MFNQFSRIVLALSLAIAIPAVAQAQQPDQPSRTGAGYFMIGARQLDLGGTDRLLRQSGFSDVGSGAMTIGGGGHFGYGRFMIGGEGHFVFTPAGLANSDAGRAYVHGGFGLFRLGYMVISTPHFNLYPLLGLGGGGMGLKVPRGSVAFDDPKADEVSTGGFLTDIGIGLDTRIPLARTDARESFMLIGLRAGYTYAPFSGHWNVEVAGEQHALGIEGANVRLVIGFGSTARAR